MNAKRVSIGWIEEGTGCSPPPEAWDELEDCNCIEYGKLLTTIDKLLEPIDDFTHPNRIRKVRQLIRKGMKKDRGKK